MILTSLLSVGDARACDDSGVRNGIATVEQVFRTAVRSDEAPERRAAPAIAGLADAEAALACLEEPISPSLAARLHGADALVAWLLADPERVHASLRAVSDADPTWSFPAELVAAAGGFERAVWRASEAPATFDLHLGRWVLVDGLPARTVPIDVPYVLQRPRADGPLHGARIVPRERRIRRVTLVAVSLSGAAVAAGLAGGALATGSSDAGMLPMGLGVGAGVSAAVAVGSGVASLARP